MIGIKEAIKDYVEGTTHAERNTFNYRVEQVNDDTYGVYIINSFADIEYMFYGVQRDADGYSAEVELVYCKILQGFYADSNTDYYVDALNRYIEDCKTVANILDSIEVYGDGTRTYF